MSAILMGFASYKDGSFELIVMDKQSGVETTLHGTLEPGQLETVDRILPTCVFVSVETPAHPYVIHRTDGDVLDDGDEDIIGYEIWDERPETYGRLCTVYEDPGEDRNEAKRDAELIVRALNALVASPLDHIRGELFALCEATEDQCRSVAAETEGKQGAFARGRIHEAKGIRRAMGKVFRLGQLAAPAASSVAKEAPE